MINVVSLIFGFAGLMAAYIFYHLSRREKTPMYSVLTNTLIHNIDSSKMARLSVYYDDVRIDKLSVSQVYIWNHGRETIDADDIATTDHLRITLPQREQILEANVLYQTREANNVKIHIEGNSINVDFDFLDYKDACVIEAKFDGLHDDICLSGTIKGADRVTHYEKSELRDFSEEFFPFFGPIFIWYIVFVVMTIKGFAELYPITFYGGSVLILIVMYVATYRIKRRLPRSMPELLRDEIRRRESYS